MNELGELVRAYRKYEGLSQEDLAENVGRSITTISRIENDIPVGSFSRELVLRELGIPVFCLSYSWDYSKLVDIKREMLSALYCENVNWYMESYNEYQEYSELEGVMGEMYTEYFKAISIYLTEGDAQRLYKSLVDIFDRNANIKNFVSETEKNGTDFLHYRQNIRRNIRENESEIDVLLVNGIAVSLFLREKYSRAEMILDELMRQSKVREDIFEEKHSNVPTICYNLALCFFMEGKFGKAREKLKYAYDTYTFRDNLRLELKYNELAKRLDSISKDYDNLCPIFSFPRPIYWYTLKPEIKNLKKFK